MKIKKERKEPSQLTNWFVLKPLKFAILSVGIITGVIFLYFFINQLLLGTTADVIRTPMLITIAIGMVYSVYKLINGLPKENLDRHSFITISNGLTIIYYLSLLLSIVLLAKNYTNVVYMSIWLNSYSMILFIISIVLGSLLCLYILGLMITNMYAIYKRALFLGVPKWKAILSFPFSDIMLLLPGYMLSEDKKTKKVINTNEKWFEHLTDWIISKPVNGAIVFAIMLVFSYSFLDIKSAGSVLLFGIIFVLFVIIMGSKKLLKSIGGLYSTIAIILNIIFFVIFSTFSITKTITTQTVEISQPSNTNETVTKTTTDTLIYKGNK